MRPSAPARPHLLFAAACILVVLASVYVAWLGFQIQTMGDYPVDYAPAMNALLAGHVGAFFAALPTNGAGASVLLRAPGALFGNVTFGTQHAIFRFGALECMLAVGALGLYLARRMRVAGQPLLAQVCVVGLLLAAPALLDAIRFGHPEEPLGAVLCIAAVLLAGRDRTTAAGLVLGLAVINKPWGILAVAPVLLAAHRGQTRMILLAGSVGLAWVLGAYLASPSHFSRIVIGASTSVVAHPVDAWWPFAHLHVAPGVERAYFPPALISAHARELAVLLAIPLSLPLARAANRTTGECLALLALLFGVRCLLDPSNHVYYQLPLVLALVAWEATTRGLPVVAMAATFGFWFVFHTVSGVASLNVQFAAYLAVMVPVLAVVSAPATGRRSRAQGGALGGNISLA